MLVGPRPGACRPSLCISLGTEPALGMAEKTHQVLERLPQHRHTMQKRMLIDREFRSLCDDYDDALEALRRWELSDDRHRQERVQEFRSLLAELEEDILRELAVS